MGLKEDLDILDTKISKLRVDYEQYFAKILKREPSALRDDIDRLIIKYSNQQITNTSLKFRYSTLTSKYTSYRQFWDRILRQIEEGTYARGTAVGARAPEAPLHTAPIKNEKKPEDNKFRTVYQQYMEARKKGSESSKDMTYEEFSKAIVQQTEKIKRDYNCKDVEYKVTVKDGKTKISLIPVK
jgi:hypothetical protein